MHAFSTGCPCNQNTWSSVVVPSFMGENYFCESGNYDSGLSTFYDEPLWDGDGRKLLFVSQVTMVVVITNYSACICQG
jgi:hypothetical protein